ncbi:MAG: hypothetical protein CFH01_00876 [Alphaproteobacteria bacterium MarineAlpha2_Bin1]|nr:MAG: hypothetical protein CFH01_00876 [Alphaproteobacteria bacterium MarineAlpha2_Bin1]|tara:strand:- start:639 stop:1271 length:633 start_codon:yes stop_codon:yes gene_type:complete
MKNLEPNKNCIKCIRLSNFRKENILKYPSYFNNPVSSFGSISSELLIVGLAPGIHGANKTGRPFTGDYAGILLYNTLIKFKFATGNYLPESSDNLNLKNCRITNAVKCVPPKNKPEMKEIKNCRMYLKKEIYCMKNLKIILSLGTVAHNSIINCFDLKLKDYKFSHGKYHIINKKIKLINSYHCSRYNTNTKRLSKKMFEENFKKIISYM